MYTRDGEIRWIRDEAALVREPDGTPLYWQGIMFDVTAEVESEERIRQSEARYGALVDQLPAIVYSEDLTGDGLALIFINERVEHLLGIGREEWLGDPSVWLESIHPEDRARVEAENARVEATGEPFEAEYRMIARDGRVRWFADRAVVVPGPDGKALAWQGVMLDITDRKRAETERAEAEERYRALVEQIPVVVYIDPVDEGATVYISPQSETMFGYPPQAWYEDAELWSKIDPPRGPRASGRRARDRRRHGVVVPGDRRRRADRVGPRHLDADPRRRRAAPVLAGRARRRHRAASPPGAGTRPRSRARRGRATARRG